VAGAAAPAGLTARVCIIGLWGAAGPAFCGGDGATVGTLSVAPGFLGSAGWVPEGTNSSFSFCGRSMPEYRRRCSSAGEGLRQRAQDW
jgi:hypothetical protein